MLATEQDAVMKKWCHAVSNIFPPPASRDEGKFLPMPGVGLHDVAKGDQRFVPIGAAQGILWLGRHALRVHCAVMEPRVARPGPNAVISTLFGQQWVNATSWGRYRGRIAATITQFSSENRQIIESRAGNDEMPTANAQYKACDERCGIW